MRRLTFFFIGQTALTQTDIANFANRIAKYGTVEMEGGAFKVRDKQYITVYSEANNIQKLQVEAARCWFSLDKNESAPALSEAS